MCEHGGRLLFRERGEGHLRRRSVHPACVRSGRTCRDVHLLGQRRSTGRVPGHHGAGARARANGVGTWHGGPRVLGARTTLERIDQHVPRSIDEAAEAVRTSLVAAVRLRMLRADVPVGSYLSGGLDSSLIAAMGRGAKEGEFRTFSVRFEDAEYDETDYQRMMAATIDTDHHEIIVRQARHRRGVPGSRRACRAPTAADRTRADVPAVAPGSGIGHQRSCSRVKARTRCSQAMTSFGRRGSGASGVGDRSPGSGPGCSSDCIRTWSARRSASARWRRSSLAATVSAGRSLDSDTRPDGDRRRCSSSCSLRGVSAALAGRDVTARLLASAASGLRVVELPGPGPVPRGAHPALRLSALVARRPHAHGSLGRGSLPIPRPHRRGDSPPPCRTTSSSGAWTRSTFSSALRAGWFRTPSSTGPSSRIARRTPSPSSDRAHRTGSPR